MFSDQTAVGLFLALHGAKLSFLTRKNSRQIFTGEKGVKGLTVVLRRKPLAARLLLGRFVTLLFEFRGG
jgi:hypothetical protein